MAPLQSERLHQMQKISLYHACRLQEAQVCEFSRIMKEIKEDAPYRGKCYSEVTRIIRRFHDSRDISVLDKAIETYRFSSSDSPDTQVRRHHDSIVQLLTAYRRGHGRSALLRCPQAPTLEARYVIPWSGIAIQGGCHVALNGADGMVRFRYHIYSRDWSDRAKRFGVRLLAEIICHQFPEFDPDQIEGIDCRTGKMIRGNFLSKPERARLDAIARIMSATDLVG